MWLGCRRLAASLRRALAETIVSSPRAHRTHCPTASTVGAQVSTALHSKKRLPHIIETRNVPVYLYADPDEVEPDALKQLIRLAESPLPVGYVSAMPDVHVGAGATIGTVFASAEYVCPNAKSVRGIVLLLQVGVDIGCGMCAVPIEGLHKDDLSLTDLVRIQQLIKRRIPTGFDRHRSPVEGAKEMLDRISSEIEPTKHLLGLLQQAKAATQLGTLGGGNHFVEVVHDESGVVRHRSSYLPLYAVTVWAMLHSGSRNIGNRTAQHYDQVAQARGFADPGKLNHLCIDSQDGRDYLQDMQWNQLYAFHNRRFMLEALVDSIQEVTGRTPDMSKAINRHHNYCACQRCKYKDPNTGEHVEKDLWVTRKGATSAEKGELGIIPGSMGVGSFIVKGKGNPLSWKSCSHGAGRRMSRTKAFANISQDDFVKSMEGIVCDTDALVRDEAPAAYKNLTTVMANQDDLVDVVYRLRPLINVKGFEKRGKRKQKQKN